MTSDEVWRDAVFGPSEAAAQDATPADPRQVAAHLARLLAESGQLPDRYSYDHIHRGLWRLGGVQLAVFRVATRGVPADDKRAWAQALGRLYTDLFAACCTDFYGHLDRGPDRPNPVNTACYMLWDMDGGPAVGLGDPDIGGDLFRVLEDALASPALACVESALHGLGHVIQTGPHKARAKAAIDRFLGRRGAALAPELVAYARAARSGGVQ